jgi:hypothetical protein
MFIVYYLVNYFTSSQYTIIEGMKNKKPGNKGVIASVNPSSVNPSSDYTEHTASHAEKYAANIKAATTENIDKMTIKTYPKDYDDILINIDDYISTLMMQQVLSLDTDEIDPAKNISYLANLASLQQAKTALNSVMTFVDNQKQ